MKRIILAAGFMSAYFFAGAQTHADFGIKAGANIANLSSSNSIDFKSKASFHFGGLMHLHLSKYFALQPELLYSGQGAKLTQGNTEYKYSLNYVNIPVLFQYMAGNGFRLQTGPQVGFLTRAETEAGNVTVKNTKDYNSADFAWTFGGGYLSTSGVGFDARYNVGISDISKSNSVKLHNNVVQLGLFYQFK